MTNINFAAHYHGDDDTVHIGVYLRDNLTDDFRIPAENAEGLARTILTALDERTAPAPLSENTQVYYDGEDEAVIAPAGYGVVTSMGGYPQYVEVTFPSDTHDGGQVRQLVNVTNLTVTEPEPEPEGADEDDDPLFWHVLDIEDDTDDDTLFTLAGDVDWDAEQAKALRKALVGVRVKVAADAKVTDVDGDVLDDVWFGGETEATIVEWDDRTNDDYDPDANFRVQDDEGLAQAVRLDDCEPLDPDDVKNPTLRVGAKYAERRGIVPGAQVRVPDFLMDMLFGSGTVVKVEDGLATVSIADMEPEYPAFLLRAADGL